MVFMVATYGEGDPTDNAVGFHAWLTEKEGELEPGLLEGVKFTVFGLGNTQYEHYNSMGILVEDKECVKILKKREREQ